MATLIREMYNDIFSDNRNITILVLIILLILVFSRIPLIESLSEIIYKIIVNLYQFAENLVYSITYSTGEILNASSNTVTGVTKTSLDLGNGAINDVGNLLSDVNCQYKGNPVSPNQCHPPAAPITTPQIVYMTVPPEPTPPTTKPRRHIETKSPKVFGKMKPTSAPPITPSFLPPITAAPAPTEMQIPTITKNSVTYTPPQIRKAMPPAVAAQPPADGEPQSLYSGQPLNYNSRVFVDNPLNPNPYVLGAPVVNDSVSLENNMIKPSMNLDNVLEGLENRQMAAFQPDPIGSSKSKTAWCFVGEMDGKRSCVEIPPSSQGCESGLVYGSAEACGAAGR